MDWLNSEFTYHIASWIELKIKFLEKFSQQFTCWMYSKFSDHDKMSPSLKNELWNHWRTENDKDGMKDEEGELLMIEPNLFGYETPMCKEFSEFNYLLKLILIYLLRTHQSSKLMMNSKMPGYTNGTIKSLGFQINQHIVMN